MKYFFVMAFFTVNVFAQDKLCDYLKKETFKEHASAFGVSKELGTVVAKVSHDLSKKVEEQCKTNSLWAVRDYDTCSSLCVQTGSPNFGIKHPVLGGNKITEVSRECQRLCKSYQLSAFSFQDGLKASKSEEGQHKCGAHINDQQFGTDKSDLVDKVKQQIKIQKNVSKQ